MVFDLKNTTIEFRDHGSNKIVVKVGSGNLSYTEKKNIEYMLDRGKLDTVRLGDEAPLEIRMDFYWIFISSASGDTAPTIEEALKNKGLASSWVSSSADPCEPYAVNVVIFNVPPCNTQTPETITLSDFRYEELAHDAKTGMISLTGKCNVTQANAVRGAISS